MGHGAEMSQGKLKWVVEVASGSTVESDRLSIRKKLDLGRERVPGKGLRRQWN